MSTSSNVSIIEKSIVSVTPRNEPCKDLRVSNKEANDRSKLEINFLDCFQKRSPDLLPKAGDKEAKKRIYDCKYCNTKFSSLQALGGHQNGHKRERALAKNSMNATATAWKKINSLLNPYWRMARKPYGSLDKTLGVQTQSMIHKPYNHGHSGVLGHGYQEWPRATNYLNPHTAKSALISGFKPLEMTNLNSANQHIVDMVINGNYNKGTYSSQSHKNETIEVDLSLKL